MVLTAVFSFFTYLILATQFSGSASISQPGLNYRLCDILLNYIRYYAIYNGFSL